MKPSESLLSVSSFLAAVLPGTLMLFSVYLMDLPKIDQVVADAKATGDVVLIVLLFFAAFLLGHIANMLGSYFDPIWKRIEQRKLISKDDPRRASAKYVTKRFLKGIPGAEDDDHVVRYARQIVAIYSEALDQKLNELDAESKFFRSTIIPLVLISGSELYHGEFLTSVLVFAISLGSFLRYGHLRTRHKKQLFNMIVTLNHQFDQQAKSDNKGSQSG